MEKASNESQAYERGYTEGRAKEEKQAKGTLAYLQREHEKLKESVAAFNKKSGVGLDAYDGGQIGVLVKALFEKDWGGLQDHISRMKKNLEEALEQIEAAKQELIAARKEEAIER
jgi:predicted RNase H-like nuclease (RuvC/YqgF family)